MKNIIKFLFLILVNSVFSQAIIYDNGTNVGIGTTDPTAKLHIDIPVSSSGYFLKLANKMQFRGDGVLEWGNISDQGVLSWDTGRAIVGALANQDLALYANGLEKFRIKSDGNIGIGTSSPTGILHVKGNSGFNQRFENSTLNLSTWISSESTEFRINSEQPINLTSQGIVSTLYLNEGKVGIGTTDTKGFELGVKGKIVAEEVKVVMYSNWADFVFNKNYHLPTLKEVEQHIKEKGHLKDIPSAVEVKKDGFFLGEMDSKLLQKIEELTLYTIEQQKEIEIQKSKLEKLEKENAEFKSLSIRLSEIEKLMSNEKY